MARDTAASAQPARMQPQPEAAAAGAAGPAGGRAIFRHQPVQQIEHPRLAAGARLLLELVDRAGQHRVVGGARRGEAERRVAGRHRRFGGVEQLLVQLLAGAQPDIADRDVALGREPGEADHLARQIDDLDRLAHVEDENLAARVAVIGRRRAVAEASSTSSTASRTVMKKRLTSGWVTVSGPPAASWRGNSGTTDPVEPSTLPKRTVTKRVPGAGARAPHRDRAPGRWLRRGAWSRP